MCVYKIKKMCLYIYLCGGCLDKYISTTTWPPPPPNKNSWLRLYTCTIGGLNECGYLNRLTHTKYHASDTRIPTTKSS